MDIIDRKEEKKILELIIATSEEFLQSVGGELNYQKITNDILDISGAKYAGLNLYDEDGSRFTTVAFSAPQEIIKKVSSLLGFKLTGKRWDHVPVPTGITKSTTINHFLTIGELVGDLISKPVIFLLEKTLNMGEVILVKILKENIILGNFTLIMPKKIEFKNDIYIEIYAHQVGLLIARKRVEEALRQRERDFASMVENATDMIVRFDTEMRYIYCNSAVEQQLGIPVHTIIGKKGEELGFALEQVKFVNKMLSKTLETGEVQKAEQYLLLPSGQKYFSTTITPERDAYGKIESLLAITRDITDRKQAEESLRESTERHRTILRTSTSGGFWLADMQGRLIEVNEAYCRMSGYSMQELLGMSISDLEVIEKDNDTAAHIQKIIEQGEDHFESRHRRKDGSIYDIEASVQYQATEGGRFVAFVQDITERKLSEVALRANEERYRIISEQSPIAIEHYDKRGRLINVNPACLHLFGIVDSNEIQKFSLFADPNVSDENKTKLKQGEMIQYQGLFDFEKVKELNLYHTTKSGSIWLDVIISPIKDNQGKVEGYLLHISDITERKRAEELLQENEKRFDLAIEGTEAGLWDWNMVSNTVVYSKRWKRMLGYDDNEIEDSFLGWKNLWHPDDSLNIEKSMEEYLSGKTERYEITHRLRHKNGSWRWITTRGAIIKDSEGKQYRWVGTNIDVTERNKTVEALRKSEIKYRQLFDNMTTGFALHEMIYDEEGNPVNYRFLEVNSAFEKLTGLKASMLIGKTVKDVIPDTEQYWIDTYSIVAKTGESISFQNYAEGLKKWYESWVFSPSKNKFATIFSDITERKKAEEEIVHLSFHDHLTGLYNRRFFEEELKRQDIERQLPLSFIMGDLNGLKVINDVFGHDEGDRLLKETGEMLKTVCRSDDILAHWGGDEFVVLLPKTSLADTEEIIERIKKECKKTKSQKITLSLSLGTAIKETAAQDIQTIIIDAESNMYKNKLVEKASLTSSIIYALKQALYEKSNETKEHTDRMHKLAIKLGKSINLPSRQLDELSLLASLHDIGKVAISETILLKKGKLTEKEWSIIKRHPEIGFNIAQSSPQISHISKSILSCHENFDGSGYPLGIKGESIPVISRIILIVDAYDVMTNRRTYKEPVSKEDAIAELKRCAGTQFDPVLVNKFISIITD